MKQPVRFFSIGLFTASSIVFIIFLLTNTSNDKNALSTEEMIASIETDGYRIITEDEYITYTINKDIAQQEEKEQSKRPKKKDSGNEQNKDDEKDKTKEQKKDKPKDKDDEKSVKTYTVKVKSGMVPGEIAKLLEENGIIDDAFSFATYLEDNGYSPYVQIGSFKVTSDMSRKEIAEKITKNRRP